MSNVAIFNFESKAIRSVLIEGEPWFVGKDVAESLGYSDTVNALKQHCRGVVKHHPILDSLGRTQEARILSEPDVLRLIVGSKLPAAQAFEAWVFEEVLPSIRKTGKYAVKPAPTPTSSLVVQFTKDYLDSAALFGVPLHLAQVEAVKAVKLTHNVDFSSLLQHAPAQSNLSAQDVYLEPTPLGVKLSLGSGIATNLVLAELGLQVKTAGGWQLTPLAEGKAILGQWTKLGKSGTNYRWKVEAIKSLLASRLN